MRVLGLLALSGRAADTTGISLSPGAFRLACADREPAPLKLAVEALRRDFARVTRQAPPVVNVLDDDRSRPTVVIVNRASRALRVPAGQLKALDGFESHRVYADGAANRVYLDGNDLRGAIYAIYTSRCFDRLVVAGAGKWAGKRPPFGPRPNDTNKRLWTDHYFVGAILRVE